jgi:chromosome segregation ATPase
VRCTAQLNEAGDKLKTVEAELSAKGESEAKLRLERDESTKQLSELRQEYDVMRSNFKDKESEVSGLKFVFAVMIRFKCGHISISVFPTCCIAW